jgi:hypothetical protein
VGKGRACQLASPLAPRHPWASPNHDRWQFLYDQLPTRAMSGGPRGAPGQGRYFLIFGRRKRVSHEDHVCPCLVVRAARFAGLAARFTARSAIPRWPSHGGGHFSELSSDSLTLAGEKTVSRDDRVRPIRVSWQGPPGYSPAWRPFSSRRVPSCLSSPSPAHHGLPSHREARAKPGACCGRKAEKS